MANEFLELIFMCHKNHLFKVYRNLMKIINKSILKGINNINKTYTILKELSKDKTLIWKKAIMAPSQ